MRGKLLVVALLAATPAWSQAVSSQSLAGLWDASVKVNDIEIPLRMEFSGAGPGIGHPLSRGYHRTYAR